MGKIGTLKSRQQLHSSLTHLQNLSGPVASVAFSTGSISLEIGVTSAAAADTAAVTAAAAGVSVTKSTTADGRDSTIVVASSCLAFTSADLHFYLAPVALQNFILQSTNSNYLDFKFYN